MSAIESDILRFIGNLAVRQIQARIRTGKVTPQTNKRGTTLYGKNRLYNSIKYRIDGDSVVVSAGNASVPYARIHHEGGIIRPKNAKYLAIPLTAQARLYNPRQYPGETFIAKGVIFLKEPGGKPVALYALKKQVVMPERRYMYIDDEGRAEMESKIKEWILSKIMGGSNAV
ncbi:MAG: hypothetical protein EOM68_26860 [Spirochaetia bacterium]|nr:hypothetical protein [Spirochaetia bacterium]